MNCMYCDSSWQVLERTGRCEDCDVLAYDAMMLGYSPSEIAGLLAARSA